MAALTLAHAGTWAPAVHSYAEAKMYKIRIASKIRMIHGTPELSNQFF